MRSLFVSWSLVCIFRAGSGFSLQPTYSAGSVRVKAASDASSAASDAISEGVGGPGWRKLGAMEKVLCQTDAGSGTLTTPHVFMAMLKGAPKLSKESICAGIEVALSKFPLLRSRICPAGGQPAPTSVLEKMIRPQRWDNDGDPLQFLEMEYDSLKSLARLILASFFEELESDDEQFEQRCSEVMEESMNGARFDLIKGPNWSVRAISNRQRQALIFTMNHALDDQKSAHLLIDTVLSGASRNSEGEQNELPVPISMENAVLAEPLFRGETAAHLWRQLQGSFLSPQILPSEILDCELSSRSTLVELASIDDIGPLMESCRRNNLKITAALSAACLYACSSLLHAAEDRDMHRYKFLLGVDMRRFGLSKDWTGGSIACAAGAIDFVTPPIRGHSAEALIAGSGAQKEFWDLARCASKEISGLVRSESARESVALLKFAWDSIDIWESLRREALKPGTHGRLYTCALSNVGKFEFSSDHKEVESIHFGTGQRFTGSTCSVSSVSIGTKLCLTGQFLGPVISREQAKCFMRLVVACLEASRGVD